MADWIWRPYILPAYPRRSFDRNMLGEELAALALHPVANWVGKLARELVFFEGGVVVAGRELSQNRSCLSDRSSDELVAAQVRFALSNGIDHA